MCEDVRCVLDLLPLTAAVPSVRPKYGNENAVCCETRLRRLPLGTSCKVKNLGRFGHDVYLRRLDAIVHASSWPVPPLVLHHQACSDELPL